MQILSKHFFFLTLITIASCKGQDNALVFDEKDYKLLSIRNDNLGMKYSETFVNTKDTSLHLEKVYWENGKIQGIIFFRNKKIIGPSKYYDTTGILLSNSFYYNSEETGVGIQYNEKDKHLETLVFKNDDIIHQEDIKDSQLTEVNGDDLKNKYAEIFTSNNNYPLKKFNWHKDKIQVIIFFSNKKKTSSDQFYNTSMKLFYEGFDYEDEERGLIIQYGVQSKKAIIQTYKNTNVVSSEDVK